MQRSEINQLITEAQDFFRHNSFNLPKWYNFNQQQWQDNQELAAYLYEHQVGWDVTDFGSGDFNRRGLLLFCLRNGIQGKFGEKPYAEKIMVVRECQETPFHYHKSKMEDIIVRAGGNLLMECYNVDIDGNPLETEVEIYVDGSKTTLKPYEVLRLCPGQSVTVNRYLMHRFYGEPGSGLVMVGEVSQVNDDTSDNYFAAPLGRFSEVVENEAKKYYLWVDLAEVLL